MVGQPMVSQEECPGLTAGSEVGDVGASRPALISEAPAGVFRSRSCRGGVGGTAVWLGMFREELHCLITGCGKGSKEPCRKPRE